MNFLEFLNNNFATIAAVISGLGTAFLTGYFATYNQKKTFQRQKELDEEKEKQSFKLEKIRFYNKILKLNGEIHVLEHAGGGHFDFSQNEYSKMREHFFEYLHLMDNDIRKVVLEIDSKLELCIFNEEITPEDADFLTVKYTFIMTKVEDYISKFKY